MVTELRFLTLLIVECCRDSGVTLIVASHLMQLQQMYCVVSNHSCKVLERLYLCDVLSLIQEDTDSRHINIAEFWSEERLLTI